MIRVEQVCCKEKSVCLYVADPQIELVGDYLSKGLAILARFIS